MNVHTPSSQFLVNIAGHNLSATGSSSAVDTRGYTRALVILTYTTGSGAALTAALQECSTSGGSYSAVSGGGFNNVGASVSNGYQLMNIDLSKRLEFLEVAITVAGGTAGVDVTIILFNAEGANTNLNSGAAAVLSV